MMFLEDDINLLYFPYQQSLSSLISQLGIRLFLILFPVNLFEMFIVEGWKELYLPFPDNRIVFLRLAFTRTSVRKGQKAWPCYTLQTFFDCSLDRLTVIMYVFYSIFKHVIFKNAYHLYSS